MKVKSKTQLLWRVLILSLITIAIAACGGGEPTPEEEIADADRPAVTINEPAAGANLVVGQEVNVVSSSVGARGIAQVELLIDDSVIRIDANAGPEAEVPFLVAQPWTPQTVGSARIQVRAINTANISGESAVIIVEVVAEDSAANEEPTPTEAEVAIVSNEATPTLTPILTTATSAPTATPTAEEEPAPTESDATPEPTPIPLPRPTFESTGVEADGRFNEIWQELGGGDSLLGYPLDIQINDRDFAKQYFEEGLMFWWDNPAGENYIWVLDQPTEGYVSGASWDRYVDRWDGDDTYGCEAARKNGEYGPVRGFSHIWCERSNVAGNLGQPLELEAGSSGNAPYSQVQFFQGGVMLYNPLNSEVYVLFSEGEWRKFWY